MKSYRVKPAGEYYRKQRKCAVNRVRIHKKRTERNKNERKNIHCVVGNPNKTCVSIHCSITLVFTCLCCKNHFRDVWTGVSNVTFL